MAIELVYQNPEFNQEYQPEVGAFRPTIIEGGGDTTTPAGELSLVIPVELDDAQEEFTEGKPELKLIVGGLKEFIKDRSEAKSSNNKTAATFRRGNKSIIAAFEKTKGGGGSTWSVCDCGCGREAKFGNCQNIGYIRLDRRKAA